MLSFYAKAFPGKAVSMFCGRWRGTNRRLLVYSRCATRYGRRSTPNRVLSDKAGLFALSARPLEPKPTNVRIGATASGSSACISSLSHKGKTHYGLPAGQYRQVAALWLAGRRREGKTEGRHEP